MQITDRELFYTDFIWSSRSVQTVRSVTKIISPSHNRNEIWNILSPTNEMQFTDRGLFYTDRMWSSRSVQNSTDRNHSLTARYSAGVLDNPQNWGTFGSSGGAKLLAKYAPFTPQNNI